MIHETLLSRIWRRFGESCLFISTYVCTLLDLSHWTDLLFDPSVNWQTEKLAHPKSVTNSCNRLDEHRLWGKKLSLFLLCLLWNYGRLICPFVRLDWILPNSKSDTAEHCAWDDDSLETHQTTYSSGVFTQCPTQCCRQIDNQSGVIRQSMRDQNQRLSWHPGMHCAFQQR